jgi:hypothetical protein
MSDTSLEMGDFTAACQGLAASTPCDTTRLFRADGAIIIPDICLNVTISRDFSFGACPVGTDMAPITIEAGTLYRNGSCILGDGFCTPTDKWVCAPAQSVDLISPALTIEGRDAARCTSLFQLMSTLQLMFTTQLLVSLLVCYFSCNLSLFQLMYK